MNNPRCRDVRSYVLTPEPGVEDNTRLQPRSGLNIARELLCWPAPFRPNDGTIFGGHPIADGIHVWCFSTKILPLRGIDYWRIKVFTSVCCPIVVSAYFDLLRLTSTSLSVIHYRGRCSRLFFLPRVAFPMDRNRQYLLTRGLFTDSPFRAITKIVRNDTINDDKTLEVIPRSGSIWITPGVGT